MFNNKMYILISSYIDNELNEKEKTYVENKIESDHKWNKIYNTFLQNKKAVNGLKNLAENANLNQAILNKVNITELNNDTFLPIQKKYIPAAVVLVLSAVIFVSFFMFQRKGDIESFFTKNTTIVKNLYENAFTNNDLYPLNASLSNDDIYKFAVYGVLPAENQNGKYIQLGNNEKSGYFVEVADKKKLKKIDEPVPLEEVYRELNMDESQQKRIDDVLKSFKKNVEASFFAAPNQYLAVDADVWNFQNAVVYEISKNLSSKQRKEFFALTGIPYVKYANMDYDDSRKDSIVKKFASLSHAPREFLLIKPDTLIVKKINVNYDSIRLKIKKMKDNQIKFDFKLDNILSGRQKNRTVTVSVQKDVKTSEGVTVSVKHHIIKGSGISISIDTSIFRIEIPDMENIIPEMINFDFVHKGNELKMLEKMYKVKKNHHLQRNIELELREAEKNLKNNHYNLDELKILLKKQDSTFNFHKYDSIPNFDSKYKGNINSYKELKKMKGFQNIFKGSNNAINSFMNNFLDKKNSRLLDSILNKVNIDSIMNDALDKVRINIPFEE